MRRLLAVVAAASLVACGSGGDGGDGGSASPGASTSSGGASSAAAGGTALAGTWRFTVSDLRKTFGTGDFTTATARLDGARITVTGTDGAGAAFTAPMAGDLTIRCGGSLCSAGIVGFQPEGSGYRLVNAATLAPQKVETGAAVCNAPAVPDAYLVSDLTATSFSFLAGRSQKVPPHCFQVLWTVRATKVS